MGDADSWANYFTCLATPVEDAQFDQSYKRRLQLMYLLYSTTGISATLPHITKTDLEVYVKSLKTRKSPDIDGVCAEHLIMSSLIILDILCHLVNSVIKSGIGCVTPVLKKGKTPKEHGSYRCITITSIIGKLVERVKNAKIYQTTFRS